MQENAKEELSVEGYTIGPDAQLPRADLPPRRSKWARLFIWLLILLAFALLFWLVLHHKPAGKSSPVHSVTITAAVVRKGDIGVYLDAIGTVTPVYTDSITSQVTGQIIAVHYREGQPVHQGDPLIDIDPSPFRAQLLEAQGALERDTNLLAQARMDEERYTQAWARNGIAEQTLQDQQKLVLQDEGTVKLDQGTVQYDQVQVGFCHLTAPITGRVGLRLVDPGNVVQANSTTPLVVITQIQPITVVFTLAEDDIAQVEDQMRQGKALEAVAVNRTDQATLATGELQTMDNQIDTTTGTVKLRAIFANTNNALFPNQFVNTRLLVKTLHGVTLIPTSAIQQNGDTSFVYLIQNDTAYLRDVKPGVSEGGSAEVTGINPGDVVANSSFEKLQNGMKVVIAQTPPPQTQVGSQGP
jgi:membrane fusion protein, multidrug efflux system